MGVPVLFNIPETLNKNYSVNISRDSELKQKTKKKSKKNLRSKTRKSSKK